MYFTASLNPNAFVKPAMLPAAAALEFWLQNPLLVEKHPRLVAERTEQWPGWSSAERAQLRVRLKSCRDKLKDSVKPSPDDLPLPELLAFINAHEACMDGQKELTDVRTFAFHLHSREREWYRAFLAVVFRQREEEPRPQKSTTPEFDKADCQRMYRECDDDLAA